MANFTSKKNRSDQDFDKLCRSTIFPPINLSKYQISEEILDYIPERIAIAYQVIPLSCMGYILTVAMSDPLNVSAIDSLRLVTLMEISQVIAPAEQIASAIETNYSLKEKTPPLELSP